MGRATRRRPRPTGPHAGIFQGHSPCSPSILLKLLRLIRLSGGRALGAPGPSWMISFPTLMSFLWYASRPHVLTCSLIPIRRSVFMFGAAAADQSRPSSSKASHPERSTGRCCSTATRSAASTFIFSQMLRSSAAEEFNTAEIHSSSSTLWIFAVAVVAGFVVLGEDYQLSVSPCYP